MISIIHFHPSPNGLVEDPSPMSEVEEFDLELPSEKDEDLFFANAMELRTWLKTSDHPSAVEWRLDYEDSDKYGFIAVYSKWRGSYDFIDPRWAPHSRTSLF